MINKNSAMFTRTTGTISLLLLTIFVTFGCQKQVASPLETLQKTKQCPECDLTDTKLSDMDLTSANLNGAKLEGACARKGQT
jgi:uncharacterized protein YjbI with pentapeptide repeats